MSKTSIKSRLSGTRISTKRRRKHEKENLKLKPFGFCCFLDDFDPLTKYDQRAPPFESLLRPIQSVHEGPVLKFQTQSVDSPNAEQRKNAPKLKASYFGDQNAWNLSELHSFCQPIQWYIEDEVTLGKDVLWEQKRHTYNEEMDRNTAVGKRITKLRMAKMANVKYPRWYQDFSIDQMQNLMALEHVMYKDYEEMVTGRTRRALCAIGVLSTFFDVAPTMIRKLQKSCSHSAIEFLKEIYKMLTGNYFEDEGYKKFYDCNERIVLSAIAFLSFPEIVVELHRRLPFPTIPKLPPKPLPPICPPRIKMSSPYKEELFTRPDWATYFNRLQRWQARCKLMKIPKIILPSSYNISKLGKSVKTLPSAKQEKGSKAPHVSQAPFSKDNTLAKSGQGPGMAEAEELTQKGNLVQTDRQEMNFDIPRLPDENQVFDFTVNGIGEKAGPVEYKICGTLKPPQPNKKSWLGEKDAHYIISGANDEPPSCPVTYEMSGIANVTPTNSDERFFAVLKLGDGPKQIYPSGRKNLSKNWQEWLQNADEEFRKVEREANKMIKSIEATMRLVFPGPTCDSCCSCRQTRKTHIKLRETKAPYFVIDSIAEDGERNKYIVGSMAMHSPAPSPAESTVNLLEVIASEDKVTTSLVINGVTNEKGETQYYISGMNKDIVHVPSRIVEPPPPLPLRNVPPCACAVHQIFNKGLSPSISNDNIPWTKEDGLCFGKKYRPGESAAYSCKMYPGDKSCRRNPFKHEIEKLKRKKKKAELKEQDQSSPQRRMYSIADFPPCGDEHGMSVCGGPWGTLNTLTPQELEEQEKLRREILRAPPCGTKPGRAVCEGPWGATIPLKKRPKLVVDEVQIIGEEGVVPVEEEEDEEEEEEEEEKEEAPVVEVKEKPKKRGKECYMSPESIAGRKKVVKKKEGKFIPDPNYHGYDDLWNIFRTAPSEKEPETEYEKSLKLSLAVPRLSTTGSKTESNKTEDGGGKTEKIITKSDSHPKSPSAGTNEKHSREDSKKVPPPSYEPKISAKSSSVEKKIAKVPNEVKKDQLIQTKNGSTKKTSGNGKISTLAVKSFQQKSSSMGKKIKQEKMVSHHQKTNKRSNIEPIESAKPQKRGYKSSDRNKGPGTQHMTQSKPKLRTNGAHTKVDKRNKKIKSPIGDTVHKNEERGGKFNFSKNLSRNVNEDKAGKGPAAPRNKEEEQSKNKMKFSEMFSHIEPAILPEEPPSKCQREFEQEEDVPDPSATAADPDVELLKKGPCGWRTKSEQELPTKKNLVYLTDADYPLEEVSVRPGGKPCTCRENRSKKKILLYNIGGLLDKKKPDSKQAAKLFGKKKGEEEEKKMQVIDGVIYYTPPPSPRRSDEYVPEYDLYDSPYDMCLSQRTDKNLQLLEQSVGPKSLVSGVSKNVEPCGCNDYIDSYGLVDEEKIAAAQQADKARREFVESKSAEERWSLALKDVGLVDYFTRCRDNLPCWLKCNKFDKIGCPIRHRRLKVKKPVCECRYERKILERREEKAEWKRRQQKLKSLKKQAFVNVVDTSRPIEPDTKLLISGVKRIPREDEYTDDIKYCITGVAKNYSMAPPKQVVGGLAMATPVETPEASEHDISYAHVHRHWSPINIPPGPLPRKDAALIAEKKRRQEALEEAYRQIYMPQEIYDEHAHSCKDRCDPHYASTKRAKEDDKIVASDLKETVTYDGNDNVAITDSNTPKGKLRLTNAIEKRGAAAKTVQEVEEGDILKDLQIVDKHDKKSEDLRAHLLDKKSSVKDRSSSDKKKGSKAPTDAHDDLMDMAKVELKRMAAEGYTFAKLPKCICMPQLQSWFMHRRGFAMSVKDKEDLMVNTIAIWNMMGITKSPKIEPPTLLASKRQLRSLTFDDAAKMKKKIQEKKAIFHSEIRKARVAFARSMWSSMEYEKFPSTSFKKAYFTYMASKEADGHVFRPWFPSEVREIVKVTSLLTSKKFMFTESVFNFYFTRIQFLLTRIVHSSVFSIS